MRLRIFKETRPIALAGGRRSQSLETVEESVRIDNRVAWARGFKDDSLISMFLSSVQGISSAIGSMSEQFKT